VDVLKMDIAFIRNIERNEKDFRLVELIVDIADYLKVPVIAEGVETQSQLKLLRDAKCDLVQGYYFSRPLPPEEFEQKILCPDTEGKSERRDNQALSENQIDVQE
jgi:EAL domain-containing protein (putative c-di-GMP-specific phosphodiesterase class I)